MAINLLKNLKMTLLALALYGESLQVRADLKHGLCVGHGQHSSHKQFLS
jgi:hypothetical protein